MPEGRMRASLRKSVTWKKALIRPVGHLLPSFGWEKGLGDQPFTLLSTSTYFAIALAVSGSWMAPKKLIEAKDWAGIETLAAEAAGLKP